MSVGFLIWKTGKERANAPTLFLMSIRWVSLGEKLNNVVPAFSQWPLTNYLLWLSIIFPVSETRWIIRTTCEVGVRIKRKKAPLARRWARLHCCYCRHENTQSGLRAVVPLISTLSSAFRLASPLIWQMGPQTFRDGKNLLQKGFFLPLMEHYFPCHDLLCSGLFPFRRTYW